MNDGLIEAQKKIQATSNAATNDPARVEAQIHLDVYQQLQAALSKK